MAADIKNNKIIIFSSPAVRTLSQMLCVFYRNFFYISNGSGAIPLGMIAFPFRHNINYTPGP
jgi:hypothetical protein